MRNRDAAHPNFDHPTAPDGQPLCGAVVSGPWAEPGSTSDAFLNTRAALHHAQAPLEASAGLLCAVAGYADVEDGGFDGCTEVERPPLLGRQHVEL